MTGDEVTLEQLLRVSPPGKAHPLAHYLYFSVQASADAAIGEARALGFATEGPLRPDGVDWLVVAKHIVVPTAELIASTRTLLEELARKLHGEYDGWEAEV